MNFRLASSANRLRLRRLSRRARRIYRTGQRVLEFIDARRGQSSYGLAGAGQLGQRLELVGPHLEDVAVAARELNARRPTFWERVTAGAVQPFATLVLAFLVERGEFSDDTVVASLLRESSVLGGLIAHLVFLPQNEFRCDEPVNRI